MPLPLIAGAGLLAGGRVLGALGGANAARRQNSILAQGSNQQNRAGMESAAVMGDFITQLRNSAPNPAAERGAFTTAMGSPGFSTTPGASRQFRTDARGAGAGAQGYGRNLADLFARIRAPGLQRRSESELLMDMGNRLLPIRTRAQDDAFLTQLRAGQQTPNPWVGMAGQGLSGVGSYLMGGGG